MKSIYKKLVYLITTLALFSVIIVIVKYSLDYIDNNPEKYMPRQNLEKN